METTMDTPPETREPMVGLSDLLAKQRASFLCDGPPALAQRGANLKKLKTALLARREAFAKAVNSDFGHRSAYETAIIDFVPLIHGINYLHRHLRKWMRPRRRHIALHFQPGAARVLYQPLGVIGIISPWNYPVSLALMPLATAVAAGNRVMLKPSEFVPATNEVLTVMLRETFPEEEVAVVTGDAGIGAAFAALPFDHLVFTGSTKVGRLVMRAASENLVPVTLELGGKSPAIVEPGFSLVRAAASIAFGKLVNAGQTCIAPDYVLVQENDIESFIEAYKAAVQKLYPNGVSDAAFASIINAGHQARLSALIDDASSKGARIITIGAANADRERALPPILIVHAPPESTALKEEIFGPILPVVAYRDIDDAIAYVNARPRPLALYLFGRDRAIGRRVLERTTSGNVTINDTLLHYAVDDLPFGGVGASGIGAYHGEEGFRALSHAKGVFAQSRLNFAALLRPPFGRVTDLVLRYLLR
jgi:coniferyl-aldehyde dehydrogenase